MKRQLSRWAGIVVFAVGNAAGAAWASPADSVREAWERYRSPGTEREVLDLFVVAAPAKSVLDAADASALQSGEVPGAIHKRAVRSVEYGDDGRDRIHLVFQLPPRDEGTALLVRRDPAGDQDEQWLYLPALRNTRRIPVSSSQTFIGTDLIYEDVRELAGERTDRFVYEQLAPGDVNGRACEVIRAVPKADTVSAYGSRTIWLDSEWRFPVKVEYFDRGGSLWKVFHAGDVREIEPGVHRARLTEMRNVQINETTLIIATGREVRVSFPPQQFTKEALERSAPR